jgi:hypothetical protein
MQRFLRSPRRSTIPQRSERRVSLMDGLIVAVIITAIIAMAVWFLFLSTGGIGPGTV